MVDDDTLREVVADPEALARWCTENPEDPRVVAHLRMLGRLDEAAIAARRSLEDPALPPLMRAVRRTRYAHVLQWQGAFTAAEEQFDLAAEETGFEDPISPPRCPCSLRCSSIVRNADSSMVSGSCARAGRSRRRSFGAWPWRMRAGRW